MFKNIHIWILAYLRHLWLVQKKAWSKKSKSIHVLFAICDHFEPYWNNVDDLTAYNRVQTWVTEYPKIASRHRDSLGRGPKHCFFYPVEEYCPDLMDALASICKMGFGEVEVHLHHDNDTSENLRDTLLKYKDQLYRAHGLLSKSKFSSEIKYGFIHGNWALDNSRPDGRWCGVNDEITILQETGCYADFTMPSAPSDTQTKTINSIYYAIDDPRKPKSHNTGIPAKAGVQNNNGLLCIQGPLAFNAKWRKWGVIPRIENGCLCDDAPINTSRIGLWINQFIHVQNRPDVVFVKLYAHGTQEKTISYFFDRGMLDTLFSQLETFCDNCGYFLYYVTARQMYNVVKGLEACPDATPVQLLDYELILNV